MLKKQALQVLHECMLIQPDPICSILLTSRLPVQLASDIQVILLPRYSLEMYFCGFCNSPKTILILFTITFKNLFISFEEPLNIEWALIASPV